LLAIAEIDEKEKGAVAAWLPANSGHRTAKCPWRGAASVLFPISPTRFVTVTQMLASCIFNFLLYNRLIPFTGFRRIRTVANKEDTMLYVPILFQRPYRVLD
jgi:hypothetical protein